MNKTCLICGTPAEQLPFGYDEEDELCIMLKLKIAEIVSQLALNGITNFITDCEYGIPMWGAEIVLAQKIFKPDITLEIYMPHERQAAKWTPNWRERYFKIHENADDVTVFNYYDRCSEELCEDADMLIYVGNDKAEVVRQFREKQKQVHMIKY